MPSILIMVHAVRRRLAALDIDAGLLLAGVMCATLALDVYHAFLSMLLAVHRRLASLHITLALDVYHAFLSMLLAEHRRLASLDIEAPCPRTVGP